MLSSAPLFLAALLGGGVLFAALVTWGLCRADRSANDQTED